MEKAIIIPMLIILFSKKTDKIVSDIKLSFTLFTIYLYDKILKLKLWI